VRGSQPQRAEIDPKAAEAPPRAPEVMVMYWLSPTR